MLVGWLLVSSLRADDARFEPEADLATERALPQGWRKVSRAHAASSIEIIVAIKQRNVELLEKRLLEAADPKSSTYGKWVSHSEVQEFVSPSSNSVSAVHGWALSHIGGNDGLSFSPNSDFCTLQLPVATVERMLQTKFHIFEHESGVKTIRSDGSYSIPAHLREHVDFVGGTIRFPPARAAEVASDATTEPRNLRRNLMESATAGNRHSDLKLSPGAPADDDNIPRLIVPSNFKRKYAKNLKRIRRTHSRTHLFSGEPWSEGKQENRDVVAAMGISKKDEKQFGKKKSMIYWRALRSYSHTSNMITPATIRGYFGMTDSDYLTAKDRRQIQQQQQQQTCKGASGVDMAIANFLQDTAKEQDPLDLLTLMLPSLAPHHPRPVVDKLAPDVGYPQAKWADTEPAMDASLISVTGVGVQLHFWSVRGHSTDPATTQPNNQPNEPFLKWLVQLNKTPCPPAVFSVSYVDNENSVSKAYYKRVNAELVKAGIRGISILFATGDAGTQGAWQDCTHSPHGSSVTASFPAGSPWATAVGGMGLSGKSCLNGAHSHEGCSVHAWDASGGGFSYYHKRPKYQDKTVKSYFKAAEALFKDGRNVDDLELGPAKGSPPYYKYNRDGRGYPDLCGFSSNVMYNDNQYMLTGGGTSAATPEVSGLFALLNSVRMSAGKSTLGFLNPLLYAHSEAFHDVRKGRNGACSGDFNAIKGWDPATGLGYPNYQRLKAIVLALD